MSNQPAPDSGGMAITDFDKDLELGDGKVDVRSTVYRWLRERCALLVWDNCEDPLHHLPHQFRGINCVNSLFCAHVMRGSALFEFSVSRNDELTSCMACTGLISEVLETASQCKLLLTSRAQVGNVPVRAATNYPCTSC